LAINIKLGPLRPLAHSVMDREWVGWSDSVADEKIYNNNRGVWRLGPRAERERYATFCFAGEIRLAVEIDHIEEIATKSPGRHRATAKTGLTGAAGEYSLRASCRVVGGPRASRRATRTAPINKALVDARRDDAGGYGRCRRRQSAASRQLLPTATRGSRAASHGCSRIEPRPSDCSGLSHSG
jgi:hypothetical protein